LYVKVEGRTDVLAPDRMECSTTLSVFRVNKTFKKSFWMVSRRVMVRSLVIELLYPALLFGIKFISKLNHLRGARDLFSTLIKRSARSLLIFAIWVWRIVKDEGPGALSLHIAFRAVEMSAGAMSASTEDMSSCAFGSG
jgi:hypothetical protein